MDSLEDFVGVTRIELDGANEGQDPFEAPWNSVIDRSRRPSCAHYTSVTPPMLGECQRGLHDATLRHTSSWNSGGTVVGARVNKEWASDFHSYCTSDSVNPILNVGEAPKCGSAGWMLVTRSLYTL
jgi:hypothetical protein